MTRERAPRSGRPDLAEGSTRYRPTAMGMAVLGSVGFALFSLSNSALALGVLIAFTLALVADLVLSRRVMAPTQVGLVALNSKAATLDGLSFRAVPIAGSFEGIEIAVGTLGSARRSLTDHIDGPNNQLIVLVSQPVNARFIAYTCRHSTLGLVSAVKGFVQILPRRFSVIGLPHDGSLDVEPSVRAAELERLRSYVPGDRPNHVHWMASAKTGQLQVRDDLWQQDELVIVVKFNDVETLGLDSGTTRYMTSLARLAIEEGWAAGLMVRVISMHDTEDTLLDTARVAAGSVDSALKPTDFSRQPPAYLIDDYVSDEATMVERLAGIAPGDVSGPDVPHYVVDREGLWLAE